MKIKLLPSARNDLRKSRHFYERQSKGLGEYFLNSIFADIDSLILFAGIHNKKYDFFRMLSKRFPYAIYYKIESDIIVVYRILDLRKDPASMSNALQ
jgi:plasmid stabilization system protein ParE